MINEYFSDIINFFFWKRKKSHRFLIWIAAARGTLCAHSQAVTPVLMSSKKKGNIYFKIL